MLKSEESAIDSVAENVSKMLELVSGHRLRIIFLKILVNKVRCSFAADASVTIFMIYVLCSSIIVENLGKVPIRIVKHNECISRNTFTKSVTIYCRSLADFMILYNHSIINCY